MTLKEKFKDVIEDAITHDQQYDSFEQIAEDFAIGFGEYLDSLTAQDMGILSIKELLEIYKNDTTRKV